MRRHYGVRTERHKLMRFYGHDVVGWELFDLRADPLELTNVYGRPEYASVERELKRELVRLGEHFGEEPPAGDE